MVKSPSRSSIRTPSKWFPLAHRDDVDPPPLPSQRSSSALHIPHSAAHRQLESPLADSVKMLMEWAGYVCSSCPYLGVQSRLRGGRRRLSEQVRVLLAQVLTVSGYDEMNAHQHTQRIGGQSNSVAFAAAQDNKAIARRPPPNLESFSKQLACVLRKGSGSGGSSAYSPFGPRMQVDFGGRDGCGTCIPLASLQQPWRIPPGSSVSLPVLSP
jgi:hypothetical protein